MNDEKALSWDIPDVTKQEVLSAESQRKEQRRNKRRQKGGPRRRKRRKMRKRNVGFRRSCSAASALLKDP